MTSIAKLLTTATFCALAAACNQDDGNTVTPDPDSSTPATCRLASLSSPGYTFTVSYDGDKRVSEHTLVYDSTSRKVFSYAGDYYTRTEFYNGALAGRDTVRLNSAGYIVSMTTVDLAGSGTGSTFPFSYEYNSGNKISKVNSVVSATQSFVAYQYEYDGDGNIFKMTMPNSPTAPTTYSYYTDKPMRVGDAMENDYVMDWGAGKVLNNAHLLKSSTRNGVITTYVYAFDADGKITSYTVQKGSASPITVTVQQACN